MNKKEKKKKEEKSKYIKNPENEKISPKSGNFNQEACPQSPPRVLIQDVARQHRSFFFC